MRVLIISLILLSTLFSTTLAKEPEKIEKRHRFNLPSQARMVDTEGEVRDLGTKKDPLTKLTLQWYAIINLNHEKKEWTNSKKESNIITIVPACYDYIAEGARRRISENWVINTKNDRWLSSQSLLDSANKAMNSREDATDGVLGNRRWANVFGNGAISAQSFDVEVLDNVNSILFGDVGTPGAIAVTIVRWIFSGPVKNRVLVERDQIYDTTDFDRSIATNNSKMSFPNIVTHELGHALGLEDLYTAKCSDETMYGYASLGETKKTSLNKGDLDGINKLY